jgi:hypothetical protein
VFLQWVSLHIQDTPYDQKRVADMTYIMLNENCIPIIQWFTMASAQIHLAAVTPFIMATQIKTKVQDQVKDKFHTSLHCWCRRCAYSAPTSRDTTESTTAVTSSTASNIEMCAINRPLIMSTVVGLKCKSR